MELLVTVSEKYSEFLWGVQGFLREYSIPHEYTTRVKDTTGFAAAQFKMVRECGRIWKNVNDGKVIIQCRLKGIRKWKDAACH